MRKGRRLGHWAQAARQPRAGTHRTPPGAASCAACTARRGPHCSCAPASRCRRSPPRRAPGGQHLSTLLARFLAGHALASTLHPSLAPGPGKVDAPSWLLGARPRRVPRQQARGDPRVPAQDGSPGGGSGPAGPPWRSAGWRSSSSWAGRPVGSGTRAWRGARVPRREAAWGDSTHHVVTLLPAARPRPFHAWTRPLARHSPAPMG